MGRNLCPHISPLLLTGVCGEGNHPRSVGFGEFCSDDASNGSSIVRGCRTSLRTGGTRYVLKLSLRGWKQGVSIHKDLTPSEKGQTPHEPCTVGLVSQWACRPVLQRAVGTEVHVPAGP